MINVNRRYSVIFADRSSGVVKQLTFRGRRVATVAAMLLTVSLGAAGYLALNIRATIDRLTLNNAHLELENSSYRAAAGTLTEEMASLRTTLSNLAKRVEAAPHLTKAIDQLPRGPRSAAGVSDVRFPDETTQALLRLQSLLGALDLTLQTVSQGVAYREALTDATPIMWPADGWVSAGYGYRSDPFTGERTFHPAVDISTRKGQPVYATATGRVISAARNGAYGNLVEIDHGFGLMTRYGHLANFAVVVGDTVLRGDVVGSVGATGRATGYHVHYEVWASGQTVNPRKLLIDSYPVAAN